MYESYINRMKQRGNNFPDMLQRQTESVAEATWMQTTSYRPVIVKRIDKGLPTFNEEYDEILDAHFEQKSKFNITGDEVAYWLRFKPRARQSHPEIDVGSYVSIPDCEGDRETWLIIHIDDDNGQKWFQILKCNYVFKWVIDGKIYECLGCQRYANSYNSGEFIMDRTTKVENITGAYVPTNSDTDLIEYNQRFMITNGNREIPICWEVSKIVLTNPIGISRFSLAQVPYNPDKDNKTLKICDYYSYNTPVYAYDESEDVSFAITYSGIKPTVKVGGTGKLFTAQLPDDNNFDILWSIFDGNTTYTTNSYDNTTKTYGDYTVTTTDRTLRVKIAQNYSLVGTVLTIKAHCADGSEDTINAEVVA